MITHLRPAGPGPRTVFLRDVFGVGARPENSVPDPIRHREQLAGQTLIDGLTLASAHCDCLTPAPTVALTHPPRNRVAPAADRRRSFVRQAVGVVGTRWVNNVLVVAVGVAIGVGAWLAIAPWDLSEVDGSGRIIAGGGDHLAPRIGAALAFVTAMYCVGALVLDRLPIMLACAASCASWVALWVWRVGVARVDGVNLWPLGLVFVVIPAAAVAFGAVAFCSLLRSRRQHSASPPFDQ